MSTDGTPPFDPQQPTTAPDGPRAQAPPPPVPYTAPGGPSTQGTPATMTPHDERTWGTIAHVIPIVASIVSAGFLGFVASIVVYAIYKDRGPFVRRSAANALNIQIMEFIGVVISAVLFLVLIGFVTLPLVIIVAVVLHIIAAVKANNGEWYDPPMVPRFVK